MTAHKNISSMAGCLFFGIYLVTSATALADTTTLICNSIEFPAATPTQIDIDSAANTVTFRGQVQGTRVSSTFDAQTISFHVDGPDGQHEDGSIDRVTGRMTLHLWADSAPQKAIWHYDCHAAKPQF